MSTDGFNKIAVIGAGTMGSGIAAQIANAGHEVMLLDLPAPVSYTHLTLPTIYSV